MPRGLALSTWSCSAALGKRDDERVLVFDLGGGTFDVSIADVGGRAGALLLFFHV